MKTCLIISGGEFCSLPENLKYEYCIACDKGYEYSVKLGIKPDIVLGDFDSYEGVITEDIGDIPIDFHPVEKDDTDTMLAIKHAIGKGYKHLVIICALGGRVDHMLANIQSMTYASSHGCICEIYSDKEYLRTFSSLLETSISLPAIEGVSLSLFSLTDICDNLTISGAKYNIENHRITNDFPLCFGNTWQESEVRISLGEGILLIVESKM